MAQVWNLGGYDPMAVDAARQQNRLRSLRVQQAEGDMQRRNRLADAMGNLYTEEPVTQRRVSDVDALRPGPGGGQSGGRAGPSPDQMQRGTEDVQVGTRRRFNPDALDEVMRLDPGTGVKIQQMRAQQSEAQRAQEDREAAIVAHTMDAVEQADDPEEAYRRSRQFLAERGVDVTDMPQQYSPMVARLARARAATAGLYDMPEGQSGGLPAAVREAMFITGGDADAARRYLRQQNADTGGDTQRARKIRETMDNWGVDRRTAQAVVDGIIDIDTDKFGNVYKTNSITGETDVIRSTAQDAPAAEQPEATPGRADADDMDYDPAQATGLSGFAARPINWLSDIFTGRPAFEEARKGKVALNRLRRDIVTIGSADVPGRPSDFARQLEDQLTVTPNSIFEGDDNARRKLETVSESVGTEIQRMRQMLQTTTLTGSDRSKLRGNLSRMEKLKAEVDNLLSNWGQGSAASRPSNGQQRPGADAPQTGLPEGIPEGSTNIGQTRDGNPVYQTPDGRRLVVEQN